ncbi:MAG: hypothetical protein GX327_02135 [Epulopiscium sp.]|nr:hypothetical protein [Candidatus Epulonipiscium sp.]
MKRCHSIDLIRAVVVFLVVCVHIPLRGNIASIFIFWSSTCLYIYLHISHWI